MLPWIIEITLGIEFLLTGCEALVPASRETLPLCGSHFGQTGALLIVAVGLAQIGTVLSNLVGDLKKKDKKS
jgi:hypothetical protein